MSRLGITQVVRRFCLECQGDSSVAVQECADHECALWEWRLGKSPADSTVAEVSASPVSKSAQARLTARARAAARRPVLRAVRRHCLCCATCKEDVRACAAREDCLLWSFRFGVLPETYRAVRQRFLRPKTISLFESK